MSALLVQIADDVPPETIDHIYRIIVRLAYVTGAMPIAVDSDVLRSEIQSFIESLTPAERDRLLPPR